MGDSTGLDISKQSGHVHSSGELGSDDAAGSLQIAVLCKDTEAADGSSHALKEQEKKSGGRRFI